MKEFNIQSGEGEFIIHLNGDNSIYEVIYDHGQIIFQNDGRKYIIPENIGNKLTFLQPDPNTGKRTYITDNVRSLYRDTTPTDFGLGANLSNVGIGSSHFTEEIVVGGINESIPVVAPAGVVIYVNGSPVSSGSTVENGDVVKFEISAPADFETTTNYNLSVGDITKTFSVTTEIGIKPSCKAWLESGFTDDGIYLINPDSVNTLSVYCDMTTDGGGWTLVLGAGTKFGTSDTFWNGTSTTDTNHYYHDMIFSTTITQNMFKNLPFTQLMLTQSDTEKPIFTSSVADTTFTQKKSAGSTWTGGSAYLNNLSWGITDRDGYTYADFVLGGLVGVSGYGDYTRFGIGATVWPSSLSTAHHWTNGDGTTESTALITGTYYHSIAQVYHRGAGDSSQMGLFFR